MRAPPWRRSSMEMLCWMAVADEARILPGARPAPSAARKTRSSGLALGVLGGPQQGRGGPGDHQEGEVPVLLPRPEGGLGLRPAVADHDLGTGDPGRRPHRGEGGEQVALSAERAGHDGRRLHRPARLVEGAHPPDRRRHPVAQGLHRQERGLGGRGLLGRGGVVDGDLGHRLGAGRVLERRPCRSRTGCRRSRRSARPPPTAATTMTTNPGTLGGQRWRWIRPLRWATRRRVPLPGPSTGRSPAAASVGQYRAYHGGRGRVARPPLHRPADRRAGRHHPGRAGDRRVQHHRRSCCW